MRSKTRSTAVGSPPQGPGLAAAQAPAAAEPAPASAAASGAETRVAQFRRKAHRGRLHGYAVLAVALVAFLLALATSNTVHVKVNWVFGSSHVSLVWLVLFAAILGWLLGLAAATAFRWRTRAPRRVGATS
jgi:uncharacterized integral membrane protein